METKDPSGREAVSPVRTDARHRDDERGGDPGRETLEGETHDAADHRRQVLVAELVHLLGLFLSHSRHAKGALATEALFKQCIRYMELLSESPASEGQLIVRQSSATHRDRPFPDYLVFLGDGALHGGNSLTGILKPGSHAMRALEQAFGCLSEQGIHALRLDFSDLSKGQIENLRLALNIVARFHQAAADKTSITFRYFDRVLTIPLIRDRNGRAEPNLTLMAGLNGLTALNARELIKQADAIWALAADQATVAVPDTSYERVYAIRSLRAQLSRPPIEINHLPLPDASGDRGVAPLENHPGPGGEGPPAAPAGRFPRPRPINEAIISGYSLSALSGCLPAADKAAQQLLSKIFGTDYVRVTLPDLSLRLNDMSRLLHALDEQPRGCAPGEPLLRFLHECIDRVPEVMLADMNIHRQSLSLCGGGQSRVLGMLHTRLIDLVTLAKERVLTRNKLLAVQALGFDFDTSDTAALAERFEINDAEVTHILSILKTCFDPPSRFRLAGLQRQQHAIQPFADTLFEMLWCYLKQTERPEERLELLTAIGRCGRQLTDVKHTFRFLLSDIYHDPFDVGYSDRNAFLLVNALLLENRHHLNATRERTPEYLLQKTKEISQATQQYAAWRIDADQARVLTKQRTMNDRLMAVLDGRASGKRSDPDAAFLLALEREALIFLAVTGGQTGRIVLRDALARYGDPQAECYRLQPGTELLQRIMENMQVAVRGLGRIGEPKDVDALNTLERTAGRLKRVHADPAHARKVHELVQHVSPAIRAIQMRQDT